MSDQPAGPPRGAPAATTWPPTTARRHRTPSRCDRRSPSRSTAARSTGTRARCSSPPPSGPAIFIPRFCYHPRMKPVGMCRMCLVEVSGPRGASLQPGLLRRGRRRLRGGHRLRQGQEGPGRACSSSCSSTTRSTARCATRAASARSRTRRSPTGRARAASSRRSATSRSRSRSPSWCCLDRERCIQCGRCTRFADEVAGEALIDFIGRGDLTRGRHLPRAALHLLLLAATPCRSARSGP